jgi:DNA polymerase III delta prime subunit
LQSAQPTACQLFEAAVIRKRLAHAYLLVGSATCDKEQIAQQLAGYLNCTCTGANGGKSCLTGIPEQSSWCRDCLWIGAGKHPRAFIRLEGTRASQKIAVEDVRALAQELSRASANARVIVIPEAAENVFHRASANALLKSIEEAPEQCIFILFADNAADVLPTVTSRCQTIPVLKNYSGFGYVADERLLDNDMCKLLQDAERALEEHAREHLGIPTQALSAPCKRAAAALAFAQELDRLFAELDSVLEGEFVGCTVLDLVCGAQLGLWRHAGVRHAGVSAYLAEVHTRLEEGKRQIKQFVKPANVFESLSFALMELQHKYSGELCLAKD